MRKSNSEEKKFVYQDMLGLYCLALICLYEYTVTYVLAGSEDWITSVFVRPLNA